MKKIHQKFPWLSTPEFTAIIAIIIAFMLCAWLENM